ncbi:hypothetical protein [Pseudoalteromonas piratica]|uniref:Uncharacterized protein n=1 Tax=Pseudoalteromonas piratica TaxID=1348114 RepID=A0A0A7EJ86_9GAMM|nr:hypothetical protein [Pseudoalteromonas piratica]AIY66699.1 hypothetical protein OM33_16360 [Pseudoalteromonas piratica]
MKTMASLTTALTLILSSVNLAAKPLILKKRDAAGAIYSQIDLFLHKQCQRDVASQFASHYNGIKSGLNSSNTKSAEDYEARAKRVQVIIDYTDNHNCTVDMPLLPTGNASVISEPGRNIKTYVLMIYPYFSM